MSISFCSFGRALWWRAFLVVAFCLCARGARAQDYRLGPQDVLSVTVLRHPELSAERIEIDPGGRIRLPFVGSIVASGKTVGQITAQIRQGLRRQLNEPTVTVAILQTRPQRVAVSGAVKAPGLFEIGPNWRISEAIAAAGGLSAAPDLLSATFARQGGVAVPINLGEVTRNAGSSENRRLRAGDSLRIAEDTVPVLLAGQVKTPGALNVPRGSSLRDAVALAGGFVAGAAQNRVTLTRKNGATSSVDLRPGAAGDVRVRPGDLIVVAQSNDRVAVLGAVVKPGDIALEADRPLTLSQAIIQAGGATPGAALSGAVLTRANGQSVPLDLYGLTVLGDESKNLILRAGDVVTLPEARGVTIYGAVAKPGTYPLQAARAPRVLDAITAAGGLSAPPSQISIRVSRASANAGGANAGGANAGGANAGGANAGGANAGGANAGGANAGGANAGGALPVAPKLTLAERMAQIGAGNSSGANVGASNLGATDAGNLGATNANVANAGAPNLNNAATPSANVLPARTLAGAPSGLAPNGFDQNVLNARVYDGDLITVEAIAPMNVTVTGEVKTPGVLPLQSGATLVDAIARAGGPTALGNLGNVSIRHRGGGSEAVDIHDTYIKGAGASPIYLRDDDYIVIPKSDRLVYVMGAVLKPDYYAVPVREILTVGQALSLAGGSIPNAKLSQIAVLHPTANGVERQIIDLNQKGGDTLNLNSPVRPGDVVYVPQGTPSRGTWEKITAAVGALSLFRVF